MLASLEGMLRVHSTWLREVAIWVWPSWFFLLATSGREYTRFGLTILAFSVAANVVLYTIVGVLMWFMVTRFFK